MNLLALIYHLGRYYVFAMVLGSCKNVFWFFMEMCLSSRSKCLVVLCDLELEKKSGIFFDFLRFFVHAYRYDVWNLIEFFYGIFIDLWVFMGFHWFFWCFVIFRGSGMSRAKFLFSFLDFSWFLGFFERFFEVLPRFRHGRHEFFCRNFHGFFHENALTSWIGNLYKGFLNTIIKWWSYERMLGKKNSSVTISFII
jgi:hypothetical protein